jgi:hypothetical protein
MDDNNMTTLTEAQYEWALKLVHILQPLVYEGVNSIYQESLNICLASEEEEKYLMTFQNFLSRIPKWNEEMIKKEVARIVDKSGCTYLDDLITCVHIVHLKILTSIRTGKTQKKIDITIPKLSHFIHKVYVNLSRALYSNVFLFEKDVAPLVLQKNRSEFNKMIRTAILDSIRESIPVEQLLRSYLDESTDLLKEETKKEEEPKKEEPKKEEFKLEELKPEEVKVEELRVEEIKVEEVKMDSVLDIVNKPAPARPGLTFSDLDHAITVENVTEVISAPKDVKRLEELSNQRYAERKAQDADDGDKLSIGGDEMAVDLNVEVLS